MALRDIVPDERELVSGLLREWCDGGEVDLVLTTDAGVENWATVSFLVDGPGRIAAVTTEKEHYERGETVRATVIQEILEEFLPKK